MINGKPAMGAFSGEMCYDSHWCSIIENAESIKEELRNLTEQNPKHWNYGTWKRKKWQLKNEIALPPSDSNKTNEFSAATTEDI